MGSVDMNDISLQTLKTTQQERKNEPKTKDVSFGKTKGRTRQTEQYSSLGSEIEGTKSPHIFPISTRVINSEKKRKTNLRTHNYLTRINDEQWTDLQRIKDLDNRSFNSLIKRFLFSLPFKNDPLPSVIFLKPNLFRKFSNGKNSPNGTSFLLL